MKNWMSGDRGRGSPSKVKWEVFREDGGLNHSHLFYSACIMIKMNDGMWVIQMTVLLMHGWSEELGDLQSRIWASGVRPARLSKTSDPEAEEGSSHTFKKRKKKKTNLILVKNHLVFFPMKICSRWKKQNVSSALHHFAVSIKSSTLHCSGMQLKGDQQ